MEQLIAFQCLVLETVDTYYLRVQTPQEDCVIQVPCFWYYVILKDAAPRGSLRGGGLFPQHCFLIYCFKGPEHLDLVRFTNIFVA